MIYTHDSVPQFKERARCAAGVRRTLFGAVAALISAGFLVVSPAFAGNLDSPSHLFSASPATKPTTQPTQSLVKCKAGPWGELEAVRFVSEAPEDLVSRFLEFDAGVWCFHDMTAEKLTQLLRSAGVAEGWVEQLIKSSNVDMTGTGMLVRPSEESLMALTPESRSVIYKVLATDARNYIHSDPFRYDAHLVDEWLGDSHLPAPALEMVKKLMYYQGHTALFADIGPVLRTLPKEEDKIQMLQTLTRKPSLLLRLNIHPDTDVSKLIDYWGRGAARRKEVTPLLESLSKVSGGTALNVSLLLPKFPRRLIYTYPDAAAEGKDISSRYDCHWSTMNFNNDPPDDRFTEGAYVLKVLSEDYDVVTDNTYRFGDLIFLNKSPTEGIHSCVYIADDIVFTKNGASLLSPWTLSRLSDVVAYYEIQNAVEVKVYRKK